jgi:uncharacterized protein
MRPREIKRQYETAATAEFADQDRLLLICINKTVEKSTLSTLDAVRYSWVLSPERAAQAQYILAVACGLILGAYVAELPWRPATKRNFPNIPDDHGNWGDQKRRYGFHGQKAPIQVWNRFCGKRVPTDFRNHGSPIRFVHC